MQCKQQQGLHSFMLIRTKITITMKHIVRKVAIVKGLRGKELLKTYSKATIYRHAAKPIQSDPSVDKRLKKQGAAT